jgi:hypothetical protein
MDYFTDHTCRDQPPPGDYVSTMVSQITQDDDLLPDFEQVRAQCAHQPVHAIAGCVISKEGNFGYSYIWRDAKELSNAYHHGYFGFCLVLMIMLPIGIYYG